MPSSSVATGQLSAFDSQLPLPLQASERDVILIVEDDDHIAGLIALILMRKRRQVVRAKDCASGMRLFTEHRACISMIIADARLPDGDGASLCRQMREIRPKLPVLLTSGEEQSRLSMLKKSGATTFLAKPFLPADIERSVTALLVGMAQHEGA